MNLRDAIEVVNPVTVDRELNHDIVTDFLRENKLLNTPVILNVEGKRVATNFVSSRSLLAKFLKTGEYDIAKKLVSLEGTESKITVEGFSSLPLRKMKLDLYELPILRYFPSDGGRYVTAGVIIAERNGIFNASFHRLMLLDERSFAARLVPPRHTYLMWREAIESGGELNVAVCIGTHPLFMFAASTRVGIGEEFTYASRLMGKLTLYKKDNLLLPDSEIVLFGRLTSKLADEGPFIDLTGTYDKVRKEPVLEVDEIYAKDDFIYYSITPGGKEHQMLMGVPYEAVIFKFVSNVCKVKNVVTTPGSRHYFHCVIQIEKRTEGDGKNAILAALTANPSMKGVIVVDEDIDILNYEEVEYAIATRFQADRDLVIVSGARGSSLDPSANETTTKWGIDATKPLDGEDFKRII